jgi:polar amino acid transport system permease protein
MRKRKRLSTADTILLLVAAAVLGWLYYRVAAQLHYKWNWAAIPQYLFLRDPNSGHWIPGLITQGLLTTLRLGVWASVLAMFAGLVMGMARVVGPLWLRLLGWSYVELIRNFPIIIWIFIFYYFIADQLIQATGLDRIGSIGPGILQTVLSVSGGPLNQLPLFLAGATALAIYEGAYITEIVRAGIQSVNSGQWEASAALGFNRRQQMRHIILPQAFTNILPPLTGQFISIIKDASILSVISIQELTFQSMELMAASFLTFEIWIVVMALYFGICFVCSLAADRLVQLYKTTRPTEMAL